MHSRYLGRLNIFDPLYEILSFDVYEGINQPAFHVERLSFNHLVYKYIEDKTGIAVVGKFFRLDERDEKLSRIKGEYSNLLRLRNAGFDNFPYYVVKPLAREESIGLALIEEFIHGKDLDYYFRKAIFDKDTSRLNDRLSSLAAFLYAFHSGTGGGGLINLEEEGSYFERIVKKLSRQHVISEGDVRDYLRLRDKWLEMPFMVSERVIIHGDATPTNFLFMNRGDVVAIDLERIRMADRVFDIGMVCGEIKHAFLWRTGDLYVSEPFIRYFLMEYSSHFQETENAFIEITRRNPFYMALTELRIARNSWLDWDYRKRLVWEAKECLKWGLRLSEEGHLF